MTWPTQQGILDLGDLMLQSGATLSSARLSWKTHGTLSAARDNVILYPTSYGAQHPDLEWLIGPDAVLDPTRHFIVIADMFGNGLSSSPADRADYPALVTIFDNVHAQRRLLREVFGIEHLACVYGWSMGALQAYHWAALFPDAVSRAADSVPCTFHDSRASGSVVPVCSARSPRGNTPWWVGQAMRNSRLRRRSSAHGARRTSPRQSHEASKARALPRTPPRGSAPWIPAKGGALGTLHFGW